MEEPLTIAKSVQRRLTACQRILATAHRFAESRWDPHANSFSDTEEHAGVHVVNTSNALIVLSRCRGAFGGRPLKAFSNLDLSAIAGFYASHYEHSADAPDGAGYWPSKSIKAWSPYNTALALGALAFTSHSVDQSTAYSVLSHATILPYVKWQLSKLVSWLQRWSHQDQGDYDHTFFGFTAFVSVQSLTTIARATELFGADLVGDASSALEAALFRFYRDYHSQLAYTLADMPQHYDASTLILSMCILAEHGSGVTEIPEDVLEAGLDATFRLQNTVTGQWDTATPLLGVAAGRVGCSSVELAIHLLRIPRPAMRFGAYYSHFYRLFLSLERYYDVDKPGSGWPVDIRRTGSARQTWYGFYVLEFIALLSEHTRQYASELILWDFRYYSDTPKVTWPHVANYLDIKERVDRHIIQPRRVPGGASPRSGIIIFGPPGTGKTTFARALAAELSWGMVELGPGNFVTHGLEGVFAQGDQIFQRLLLLEDVVVFFDEIDELVTVRAADADVRSRFLTTFMLPWIQQLHDRGRVVFIFATNHIERFDPAIKRAGRFDLVLPMGPPTGAERVRVVGEVLGARRVDLDRAAIESISSQVSARATVGEIVAAIEDVRGGTTEVDQDAVLDRLRDDALLITPEDWEAFQQEAERYTTVR
jgi:hypothetical protein